MRLFVRFLFLALLLIPIYALAQAADALPAAAPQLPSWLTWIAVVSYFAGWLLTAMQSLEAVLIKTGLWQGQRKGFYLWFYTAVQFVANNLGNFFPSRLDRLTTSASAASPAAGKP